MGGSPDTKEQQRNEVSVDKNPNGVVAIDEILLANLYQQVKDLMITVRGLEQKLGLQTCSVLTLASSFPLSLDGDPVKELLISSPPSADGW